MKCNFHLVLMLIVIGLTSCQLPNKPPSKSDFQLWMKDPIHAKQTKRLESYLVKQDVANVFPPEQLLSSDVLWRVCMAEQFIVPPEKDWPHMVQTLRLVQKEIIPLVGNVEALSVYRSAKINRCIRGGSQIFHLSFHAIDMQTKVPVKRPELIRKLCNLYRTKGKILNMGLGIYAGQRFHIDAAGFRTWGKDYKSSSSPCLSVVAPQHKSR